MACKYPEDSRSYKFCIGCSDNKVCSDATFYNNHKLTPEDNILPSASEANKMVKEQIKKCLTIELKEVTEKIKEAISNGKFDISGDGHLHSETEQRLKELGYKVTYSTQYNELYWKVSWK